VDAGEMPGIVGSILDWVDKDSDMHIQGAETEYYQTLNPPYEAKNGVIDDLSELLLVKGMTPELYWGNSSTNHPLGMVQRQLNRFGAPVEAPSYPAGFVDIFTPISTGKININTASATTLQVLGLEPMLAEAIVSAREGEDDGTGQTGPFRNLSPNYLWSRVPGSRLQDFAQLQRFCDVRSRTFEVEVDAEINGYKRQFIAILGRNNQRDVQVLSFYWK
jgi:general secretion pathway protein K